MTSPFSLPAGAVARLLVGVPLGHVVAVGPEELVAHPTAVLNQRPGLTALLTHDAGLSWPDPTGEALAAAALEQGGAALLVFATAADAVACHARLAPGGNS